METLLGFIAAVIVLAAILVFALELVLVLFAIAALGLFFDGLFGFLQVFPTFMELFR